MHPTKLNVGQQFIYRPLMVIGTVTAPIQADGFFAFKYVDKTGHEITTIQIKLDQCDALCSVCRKDPATHEETDYISNDTGYGCHLEQCPICDACCKCSHIPKTDVHNPLKWCPIIQATCKGPECQAFAWAKRTVRKGTVKDHFTPTCYYLEGRIRDLSRE